MKKVMFLLLLASSIVANAQFGISVRNGMLISNVNPMPGIGYENINKYIPELGFSYSFKNLSINTGIVYINSGYSNNSNLKVEPGMPSAIIEYTYSYLSIPLSLAYQITIGKLFIAPQVGLSSNIYTGDIITAKSFVPSVLGGVSIGYTITEHFGIDLSGRYNYALSEYDTRYTGKINSTAILLGINYKF